MNLLELVAEHRAELELALDKWTTRGSDDECWLWQGGKARGYGQLSFLKHPHRAHRVRFALDHGWLPEVVMHACDNRPCVNPAHLKGGTQLDNMRDMHAKGRARPYRRPMPPLTHAYSGYLRGCRCDTCGAANVEYRKKNRDELRASGRQPKVHNRSSYLWYGCRCDACVQAHHEYQAKRRAAT